MISKRIQSSDKSSHTGSQHNVNWDIEFLQTAYRTNMGGTFRPSSTQDKGDGRSVDTYRIQTVLDLDGRHRVSRRIYTLCMDRRR